MIPNSVKLGWPIILLPLSKKSHWWRGHFCWRQHFSHLHPWSWITIKIVKIELIGYITTYFSCRGHEHFEFNLCKAWNAQNTDFVRESALKVQIGKNGRNMWTSLEHDQEILLNWKSIVLAQKWGINHIYPPNSSNFMSISMEALFGKKCQWHGWKCWRHQKWWGGRQFLLWILKA